MGNTVRLDTLPQVAPAKQLAQVQAGTMSVAQYRAALAQFGVTAKWVTANEYVINFGDVGIRDSTGTMLTSQEIVEVVKMLTPPAHSCAGKLVRIMGPMVGVAGVTISRICYASDMIVDILDKAANMVTSISFPAEPRDEVTLKRPDVVETVQPLGQGWVRCRTSQLWYRRRVADPPFNVQAVLLSRVERSPRTGKWQASLYDGRMFAWCEDLTALQAV